MQPEQPQPGSEWIHRSGERYTVMCTTNGQTERPDEYPPTVVYRRQPDGTVWSRPLARWHQSMKPTESRRAFVTVAHGRACKYVPAKELCWDKYVLTPHGWQWDDNVSNESAAAERANRDEAFIAPDPSL